MATPLEGFGFRINLDSEGCAGVGRGKINELVVVVKFYKAVDPNNI